MKKILTMLVLLGVFLAVPVYADCGHCAKENKTCAAAGGGCPVHGKDCAVDTQCPIAKKFFKKACFLLTNADEIGLSDEQKKQIEALQLEMKKQAIQDNAGMQIFEMDIKGKLSEEKVDVTAINAMIDQGMAAFSASAKKSVEAYAKMKALITPDQMAKAKAIWKKK